VTISAAEQAVLDRIDETWLVELTQSLLQATGQNPPGDEAATVAVLSAAAVELGLEVAESEVEPGRANLSITLPGGDGPGLLLLGHTDVVPVGEGWTRPPFGGLVEGGRIYGRGASDMKGGLAASLAALAALHNGGLGGVGLGGPVELAALVDEEETGKGIRSYVESAGRPFLGCITAEPTDLQTIIGARGDSYLRVEVHGRACHAGNPDGGANAIYGAAAVVAEIERLHAELARTPHPLLGPATWSVGQIQGGRVRPGGRSAAAAGRITCDGARRSPALRRRAPVGGTRPDGRARDADGDAGVRDARRCFLGADHRRRTGRRRWSSSSARRMDSRL
jgi:acetylornithine deacetylase/succinyl-diaminopimelate desuccinylase-like protein